MRRWFVAIAVTLFCCLTLQRAYRSVSETSSSLYKGRAVRFSAAPVSSGRSSVSYGFAVPQAASSFRQNVSSAPFSPSRVAHTASAAHAVAVGRLSSSARLQSYVSGGGASAASASQGGSAAVAVSSAAGGYAASSMSLPLNTSLFAATSYNVPFAAAGVAGGTLADDAATTRTRRGALGLDDDDDELRPGYEREDPYETPVGSLPVIFILLLSLLYAAYRRIFRSAR